MVTPSAPNSPAFIWSPRDLAEGADSADQICFMTYFFSFTASPAGSVRPTGVFEEFCADSSEDSESPSDDAGILCDDILFAIYVLGANFFDKLINSTKIRFYRFCEGNRNA